jgi:endoglucanase
MGKFYPKDIKVFTRVTRISKKVTHMKKYLIIFLSALFIGSLVPLFAQNAFTKGVNLTGWFSAGSAKSIPFGKYTKKDFENIKSLGCDVVRLPITLHYMTSGAPDYVVDTIFFKYLDKVISWTDELEMKLIIDNHTIDDAKSKNVEIPLAKIWPQMARHYKEFSTNIIYEILNEPNTFLAADWAKIQSKMIDSIRKYDTKHTIMVTGADWGGISGLTNLKKLADTNLIYSFHFYDPMLFTHQGASWTSPSMGDLAGVPFPYDAARIPPCPASLKGSWIESSLNNSYKTDGTIAKLKSSLDIAIKYATTNNVKIYCGELGVFNLNSPHADRVEWYKAVTGYLTEKSVPWTMWDYQGGFGVFNKGSNELFEYDIDTSMAKGMGFTPPPFKEFVMQPDSVGFDIYTDFPGEGIVQAGAPGSGIADINYTDAFSGDYAIYITGIPQYNALDFDFKYNKDLSKLVAQNYVVNFWFKADSPGSSVVLRFLDTKTNDPADHPWRRDYTLNTSVAPFDGGWHHVQIPLKKFIDIGSWDGSWFNSTNSFDWNAVDRFQIVSENMALTGKKFWFDDIRITDASTMSIANRFNESQFRSDIYPNPATENMQIRISSSTTGKLSIGVYNMTGQKVESICENINFTGENTFIWSLKNGNKPVPAGIYVCKIKFNEQEITKKVSVLGL